MITGEQKRWRVVYSVGQRSAVSFLFAVSANEAKEKIERENPGAAVSLVTEDVRDPTP